MFGNHPFVTSPDYEFDASQTHVHREDVKKLSGDFLGKDMLHLDRLAVFYLFIKFLASASRTN